MDFHPYLLINYHYQKDEDPLLDREIPREGHNVDVWKDGILTPTPSTRHVNVMADSGGFQGASIGETIDPVACMEWQNRNSDIAFIVDKIPVRHSGTGTLSFGEIAGQIAALTPTDPYFIKCAEETANNLNTAFKHKDEGIQLFSIIQGHDYATKKAWLDIVSRDHDVDGFGIKGTSNVEVMSSFILIREMFPDKPVHFLGCGSFSRIAPLVYFSKYHPRVTSDASSHLQGTKSRLFIDPVTHEKWRILPDDKPAVLPREVNGIAELPCSCDACEFSKSENIDRNSTMFGRVLSLHNLRMMLNMVDDLKAASADPRFFKAAIQAYNTDAKQDSGWTLSSIIDCIEDLHHRGLEYAVSKYVNGGRQDIMDFL